jgi:MFS family permease
MVFGRYDYASFLSFIAYSSCSMVIPVSLVSLARDLGFRLESGGLTAGGALHLGRTVMMVAAMLLCGFWAGFWGKRRTYGLAVLVIGIGMSLCAMAPAYSILFLALVVAGIGEGVIEGLATPFVQDLHPEEPGRYINFAHAFWSVGVVITVLLTGALLSYEVSWRQIIVGVALFCLIPAAIILLPARPEHAYPDHTEPLHRSVVWNHALTIVRIPRFWLFFAAMFVAGGGEFALTFWSASYIQLHYASTAWAGGVGTALFAAGMVVGRTGWAYLLHQRHLRRLIIGSALAGTLCTLLLPTLPSLWLFMGVLFVAGIATAPFWPSVQSHSADRLPQTDTTMLFILLSCAGVPGCGFAAWLMGYIGNHFGGLGVAFYLVPALYLILAILIGYDSLSRKAVLT